MFAITTQAKTIKVAIIDSGYNSTGFAIKRCIGLDQDFTYSGLQDNINHGTIVTALATKGLEKIDYCAIIIKFYSPGMKEDAIGTMVRSLDYARLHKVDIVNISGGGIVPDIREQIAMKMLLDSGTTVVAASGNEKSDLGEKCNYYPACYDRRIKVVGSMGENGLTSEFSNYDGTQKIVRYYFIGEQIKFKGTIVKGTSFSTPKLTNRIIREGK